MRYETRNHYGFALLFFGMIVLVASILFFLGWLLWLGVSISVVLIGYGFFMMTRAFTDQDTEHPDYNRYQEMLKERDESR